MGVEFYLGASLGSSIVALCWAVVVIRRELRFLEFRKFAAERHKALLEAQEKLIEAAKHPQDGPDQILHCGCCTMVLEPDDLFCRVNEGWFCISCTEGLVRDLQDENRELKRCV